MSHLPAPRLNDRDDDFRFTPEQADEVWETHSARLLRLGDPDEAEISWIRNTFSERVIYALSKANTLCIGGLCHGVEGLEDISSFAVSNMNPRTWFNPRLFVACWALTDGLPPESRVAYRKMLCKAAGLTEEEMRLLRQEGGWVDILTNDREGPLAVQLQSLVAPRD